MSKPTSVVIADMKSQPVIVVATGVMRAELVRMQLERGESFRAFTAQVRETCAYITKFTCLREVDFTDSIIRDVLIAVIADLDILRQSDRHLTTFITLFGRWRYTRAPQDFLSSGDGYNRRFDAILSDFERKEHCVDDTIHYDTDLQTH